MNTEAAFHQVLREFDETRANNSNFNSCHEGWAVIKEELDELWEEVKKNKKDGYTVPIKLRKECTQIAAMALRFMVELT